MAELRELVDLREDAEALARDLADLRFRHLAGLPRAAGVADVVKAHRLATSHDGLAQASEALLNAVEAGKSAARVARLSALRDFLARARSLGLEPGVAGELLELDRRPSVRPPGDAGLHGAIPAVQVERELPFEPSRDKRGELERALADAVREGAAARSAAWDVAQAALEETGLGDPHQAAAALQARGWAQPEKKPPEDVLAEACELLLRRTDPIVQDLGAWLVERHTGARRHPAGAERHDVLHTLYAPRCASAFPRGEHLRTVRRWAEMLRLDPTGSGCVHLDEEERPLKHAGAHAVAIEAPAEVRVTFSPELGQQALSALLGALGEALLLAGPPDDAPPEDRWLGDRGVRVASAELLAGLARDPLWLRRCAKADLHRDDERALAYGAVVDARVAAAAALSSLEALKSGGLTSRAETAHRDLYARATGAELPSALALRELDPWVSPWERLRGLALAARVRGHLVERYDEDWFRNPRALGPLRALWVRGGRPTLPEIWSELGEDAPSVEPLAAGLTWLCR